MGKQKPKKQPQVQRFSEFSSHELSQKIEEHFKLPCIDISTYNLDDLSVLFNKMSQISLNSSFLLVKNDSNHHFPILSATTGWKLFHMEKVMDGNVDWNLSVSINNIQNIYSS